jgi:hypothetical protein
MPIPSDPSKMSFTAKKYGDELVKEFPALFLSGKPQKFYIDLEFSFTDGVYPLIYVGTETKWVKHIKEKKYVAGNCLYSEGILTVQIMKNPGIFKSQHEKAINVKYKTAFKVVEGTVAAAAEDSSSSNGEADTISSPDQLPPAAKKIYDELTALLKQIEQMPDVSAITDETQKRKAIADITRIQELHILLEKELS